MRPHGQRRGRDVDDLDRDVRTKAPTAPRAPASEESDDAAALEHGVVDILAGDLRTMRITGSGIR